MICGASTSALPFPTTRLNCDLREIGLANTTSAHVCNALWTHSDKQSMHIFHAVCARVFGPTVMQMRTSALLFRSDALPARECVLTSTSSKSGSSLWLARRRFPPKDVGSGPIFSSFPQPISGGTRILLFPPSLIPTILRSQAEQQREGCNPRRQPQPLHRRP